MNNILFVYPKPQFSKKHRFGFSIQLMQIASLLKKCGFSCFFIDYSTRTFIEEEFLKYLVKNKISDLIIEIDSFSLKRSENLPNALKIIEISNKEKVRTIAFGYDCTLDKHLPLNANFIINNRPLYEIPKLFGMDTSLMSYDDFPFPDRELVLTEGYYFRNKHSTILKTSEGCLNSCSFCQRIGWQKEYLTHSLAYVLNEFKYLKQNGYRNVWIADDNFTFDLNRAKVILNELIKSGLTKEMKIALSSWTHIDKEFLILAKKANVSIISMGIESANDNVLKFYHKKIDLVKTAELIEFADSLGLFMVGNFIIGAPMETKITIQNTFNYIKESKLDQVNIKILDYMIGSALYETLKEKKEHHYFGCKENGLSNFSLEELTSLKNTFLKNFYEGKKSRFEQKVKKYGPPYFEVFP